MVKTPSQLRHDPEDLPHVEALEATPDNTTMKAVHSPPQHPRLIGIASKGKYANRQTQYVYCKNNYNMQHTHYTTVYKRNAT
jgi:hypothetical protein